MRTRGMAAGKALLSATQLLLRRPRAIFVRHTSSTVLCRSNESNTIKRARLFYQSRKRGTLENGILLSSFTAKHLKDMNDQQLAQLDLLLNEADSDWQLYHWITGRETAPAEFQCDVLQQLQDHCQQLRHSNNQQPQITPKNVYH